MKKLICFFSSLCLLTFTSCRPQSQNPQPSSHNSKPVYVMVVKDIYNPYMLKAFEGFKDACSQLGVKALMAGPEFADPQAQIEVIKELIKQQVDLIAVAANDKDALQGELRKAIENGIKVVSFDSAVNSNSRQLNINQTSSETIGRVLMQAAHQISAGVGGIAILSSTEQATNQNEWIKWMKTEISQNPDKYNNMPLITIAYGDDNLEKSKQACLKLLENPNIKIIVAPTVVGMLAAAQYIDETKKDILLTGLGLPKEMYPYIEKGICPLMFMWNPIDLGYLTAYSGDALVKNHITGNPGDVFTAGRKGQMVVTTDREGGSEVIMGDPFKYDPLNISEWKDVF